MTDFELFQKMCAIRNELRKNSAPSLMAGFAWLSLDPWEDSDEATVLRMIALDGYDITGFKLTEIPMYGVYDFFNPTTCQAFDICLVLEDEPYQSFMYFGEAIGDANWFPVKTIQEAIEKYIVEKHGY